MNTKLIKIDIGYAIFSSNIHGKGDKRSPILIGHPQNHRTI